MELGWGLCIVGGELGGQVVGLVGWLGAVEAKQEFYIIILNTSAVRSRGLGLI